MTNNNHILLPRAYHEKNLSSSGHTGHIDDKTTGANIRIWDEKMSNVTILVGAQWGDEGKGKWVDIFAHNMQAVARYQGGNNAGHTLYINNEKVVLHQIPSGVFHDRTKVALTAGVVIDPAQLVDELERVQKMKGVDPDRLWLSARAQVITPWSVHLDQAREANAKNPIGTTKRGIGPTYAAKANREGLRLGHFVDKESCAQWIDSMCSGNSKFADHFAREKDAWTRFQKAADRVRPFVTDAEDQLRQLINNGGEVLLEGAQGVLLDIDHGTYPFVTSSSTAAGGALASLGLSPKKIKNVYGVAKAYTTRVGSGPFPTEDHTEAGRHMADRGKEFGATTGRARRCGWLDLVALRYAYETNGMDGVIINKMDILDELPEIKLCTAYEHPKHGKITTFPWDHRVLAECRPIYQSFKGWQTSLPKTGTMRDLPPAARTYIDAIEQGIRGKVSMVGTGVNRENALFA